MVYVRFKGIPQTDILMRNAMTYITLCVWNSRSNENTICFRLLAVHWSPSRLLTQGPLPLSALTSAQTHKDGAQHAIKLAVLLVPLSVCPFLLCSPSAPHDLPECSHRTVWRCRLRSLHVVELSGAVNQFSSPVLLAFYHGVLFQSVKTKYFGVWAGITTQAEVVLSSVILYIQSGKLAPTGLSLRPSEGCCSGRTSPF